MVKETNKGLRLEAGDKVYTILRHVSRSGMFRVIDAFVFHQKGSLHTVVMADLDDVTAFLDKFKDFMPFLPSSLISTTSTPTPSCLHEETMATFGSVQRFCKKCGQAVPIEASV